MSRECLVIQSDGIMESTLLQTSKSPWDTPRVQVPAMYVCIICTNTNSNSINFGLVDDLKREEYIVV